MQEIYYTSAPEGLKLGQQGFCTVATSSGIAKPLWDRLEAISGYRHPFDAGEARNPVAWGHWLVQVGGREVSVLSRVCDAGLDYTRRTNSFAHHLALEPQERAPAGPAWMLSQSGVMARQWDGVIGQLGRHAPLPRGDVRPAVCSAWQRMTGDAGWAGVLAESASKNARRPVCILFNAGQELLPLIAEAIALLPARLRWAVTFSTYFTSLPASAQCAWRCCLAGTPAAAEAMRHAAGWLVLDLANPSTLEKPAAGPWVDLARTGKGAAGVEPPPATGFTQVRNRFKSRPPDIIPLAYEPTAEPEFVEADPSEQDQIDAWGSPPPPLPDAQQKDGPPFGGWAEALRRSTAPPPEPVTVGESRRVDTSWSEARRRVRRRWLVAFCGLALVFIAAGTWLQVSAYRASSGRALPPPPPATEPAALAELPLPVELPATAPAAPMTRETVVAPPEPVGPATMAVARETPAVAPAPPTRPPPVPIQLSAAVEPPSAAGAGIRDRTQSIPVPVSVFDDLRSIASLQLLLKADQPTYTIQLGDLAGTLTAAADPRTRLRQVITWRDRTSLGAVSEVALVQLDTRGPKIDITWRTALLLRRPDVVALARAVLQQATLVVSDDRRLRPQRISFKPAEPLGIDVSQPHSVPTAAVELPPGISMRAARGLPAGWRMSWGWEWETGDSKHTNDTATTVLRFEHPRQPSEPTDRFEVRVEPGWKAATSTWTQQEQLARAGETRADGEVRRIDEEVAATRQSAKSALEPLEKEWAEAKALRQQSDEGLRERGTTREEVNQRINRARVAHTDAKARWDEQIAGIMTRRTEADHTRLAWRSSADGFDRIKDVDIAIELPDGLLVTTIRLTRGKQ